MTFIGMLLLCGVICLLFFTIILAAITKCEYYIKFWEAIITHVIAFVIASLITYLNYFVSYDIDAEKPKNKISIDNYLPIVGAKYECMEVKGKVYKIKVNVYSSLNSSEIEVSKDTYDSLTIGSIYFKDGNEVASYVVPINGTIPVKKE